MHSFFKFGDIDTRAYGILVTGTNPYSTPVRDTTVASVLGRNGDILIDNGRFRNVECTYTCEIAGDGSETGFIDRFREFRKAMAMATGYQELTDSYNPGITREAYLSATITPTAKGQRWLGGSFAVTFSCKPQRYTEAGKVRTALGGVQRGGINGCDSTGGTDGDLNNTETQCRSSMLATEGGETIKLSSTRTASNYIYVYVAQYAENRSCITTGRVTVPKAGVGELTLDSSCRFIRLCWKYNTMKTTDETDPQILTCYIGSKVFRFGSDRVFYYFAGAYDTKPIIEFNTSSNTIPAKHEMDGVYINIGWNTTDGIGAAPVYVDCDRETFTTRGGRSVAAYITIAKNEEITQASPVLPTLHPGMNCIRSFNSTWVYDPPYTLFLTTREWEV